MKQFLALFLCLLLTAMPSSFAVQTNDQNNEDYDDADNQIYQSDELSDDQDYEEYGDQDYDQYFDQYYEEYEEFEDDPVVMEAYYIGGNTLYDLSGEYETFPEPTELPPPAEFFAGDPDSLVYDRLNFDAENAEQLNGKKYFMDEILVKFKEPWQVPGKEKQLQHEISKVEKRGFVENLGVYVVKVGDLSNNPNAVLNRFKNNKYVEYAEPHYIMDYQLKPNDPNYNTLANVYAIINVEPGWDISTGLNSPPIALIDSGIAAVADLPTPISGYSAISTLAYNNDKVGHGTMVAGTVGAISNNKLGVTGVNWNAKIMAVKIDDANGSIGTVPFSNGIIWAADNGAKVISISIAGSHSLTLQNAINYAYNKGCIIVAGTGNDGKSTIAFPARYDNVLGVGGTNDGKTRVSFSNYGTGLDVVAIGSWYTTTAAGTYQSVSGTSFSTPQVAGLASLILAVHPKATQQEVYSLIKEGAKPIGDGTGSGVIDLGKTLKLAQIAAGGAPVVEEPRTPPIITLTGFSDLTLEYGQPYIEMGYSAVDCKGIDLSGAVVVTNTVNIWKEGLYTVTYDVSDSAGLTARVARMVTVNPEPVAPIPLEAPKITIIGSDTIKLHETSNTPYTEQSARAVDYDGTDISDMVQISGEVLRYVPGVYQLTYSIVSPVSGLSSTATRDVRIVSPIEQREPRVKYGFSGQAKAGGRITHTGIVSAAEGFMDLKVASIDKNMTISVQLVDAATKRELMSDTYSAAGSKQYKVDAANYELVVTVTKANGNSKYGVELLMPENVVLIYEDEVALAPWEWLQLTGVEPGQTSSGATVWILGGGLLAVLTGLFFYRRKKALERI